MLRAFVEERQFVKLTAVCVDEHFSANEPALPFLWIAGERATAPFEIDAFLFFCCINLQDFLPLCFVLL